MRADAEANRQELIDTAWRLFAERGADVSMNLIFKEAGVGAATLYRNFPSKEALVMGLVEEVEKRVRIVIGDHAEGWGADPLTTWRALMHDLAGLGIGALAFQLAPVVENAPHIVESNPGRAGALLGGVLQQAKDAGLVRGDVDVTSFYLGMALITRPLPEHARRARPHEGEWLVDQFMQGLAPVGTRILPGQNG